MSRRGKNVVLKPTIVPVFLDLKAGSVSETDGGKITLKASSRSVSPSLRTSAYSFSASS